MRSFSLVFSTNITQASGLTSPQINPETYEKHSERICAAPRGPTLPPEGTDVTSQSPEIHSRVPRSQRIRVRLIMTQFQRRSCLSCNSHAGLLICRSPLHFSSPPLVLLTSSETLIKRKEKWWAQSCPPLSTLPVTDGNKRWFLHLSLI